ncbi:MAG: deoxyguanosinetriphosphate triphosphohydrolase [Burkholderiaceae bacterium]
MPELGEKPLASFACDPEGSRGRRLSEADAPTRTAFQRDRDRVVHSTAFRRLVYKTQVFLNHEGDLFRTRLTHSLEVAQLARSMARTLRLNEDLVEAIALAHDLGHTPFGHAGQDALNECLRSLEGEGRDAGADVMLGFEHNLQSLRVVDSLEERYPSFDGLNLCFETREGILKHCSAANARRIEVREPDGVAHRFVAGGSPSLEAQLCNLADEIAYNAHDIDDGVRSGLISLDQLDGVPLFSHFRQEALRVHPGLNGRRLLFETIRLMLSAQVYDLIDQTRRCLADSGVETVTDVRASGPLVAFSDAMQSESRALKHFLRHGLYRHEQVQATTDRARLVIRDLFAHYMAHPGELPQADEGRYSHPRRVADYVAGMTDRFALRSHERITGQVLFP